LGADTTGLALVLAAALLAGFVDSIVGGGGLIQVPAMLAGFPVALPATLLGTNKLASILGTSSAAAQYARRVRIPWRTLAAAAAVALPAALAGASLVSRVRPAAFRALVPVALLVVLFQVLRHKELGSAHAPASLTAGRSALALAGIAGIGFYDGFFGPGTGSFLMLVFIRVYGFDFLHAAASARVINVATNAGALAFFGWHGDVWWLLALSLGLCNTAGSVLGARTALRHGGRFVRRVFIVVVALLIAKTAWDARTALL
jgi:uncharacterized membrane protein YfcA